jgi:hypothetical protein
VDAPVAALIAFLIRMVTKVVSDARPRKPAGTL